MIINDALFILLRRTSPEGAIRSWQNTMKFKHSESDHKPLSTNPDEMQFLTALQNQFPKYSYDEASYLYRYMRYGDADSRVSFKEHGVFGLIVNSVESFLTTDSRNECLCKSKSLIKFRELSHPIDTMLFVSAFLALHDIKNGLDRKVFSWPLIVRTDNSRLQHILDNGISENHFHIGGSSDAFVFSWICLMNQFTANRRKEFDDAGMDKNPLDTVYVGGSPFARESSYSLTFKAACIRYFLYQRLIGSWAVDCPDGEDIQEFNNKWLSEMLELGDDECDMHCNEINSMFYSMRKMCVKADDSGFIPDYAMYEEPLIPIDDSDLPCRVSMAVRNYERRLYRPISGEQRFQYFLFRAILSKDDAIMPYIDIAYAYLLIYCQVRGELMQINNRVGFANFLKYQDRKEVFTENHREYDDMRTSIAMQAVLRNPQVISFEGRLGPAKTSRELSEKIGNLLKLSKCAAGIQNTEAIENDISKKLSFVIHFPKKSQKITANENFESLNPRDSKVRDRTMSQANATLEAIEKYPDIMRYVTAIDACSNEINCRPEVFAPAFRKMRNFRKIYNVEREVIPIPVPRITYHAGEDFIDPVDGMRAIDEVVRFCEMKDSDRLGHALAVGIDCEEWYRFKGNRVLSRKQDLLDNLVWLYGKMHQYGYFNSNAEDHIQKYFKKYFTEIYTNNLDIPLPKSLLASVDIMDYYASFGLRGNDPMLYFENPESSDSAVKSIEESERNGEFWRVRESHGKNYDYLSIALYHYYHFNYKMKLASDELTMYDVPKSIIQTASAVQEKMLYELGSRNIGIECNPSSNYLIGTFKDYMKHPIFRFNCKHLYPPTDPRHGQKCPYILASINTDDLGIFGTSLENEYALMACALDNYNDYCPDDRVIPQENIYMWLDSIRQNGYTQSFKHIDE